MDGHPGDMDWVTRAKECRDCGHKFSSIEMDEFYLSRGASS
jgi:ribosomal protein S14